MSLKKPREERAMVVTDADIIRFLAAGVLLGLVVAMLAEPGYVLLRTWLL